MSRSYQDQIAATLIHRTSGTEQCVYASVVLFTDVHTLLAEVAIRISDVDLHLSLAGDSLYVFSLCVVELRMSDYCSVLGTYVHIVIAMESLWMV
jgi:hypothetical protein